MVQMRRFALSHGFWRVQLTDWKPLKTELEIWWGEGLQLPFWWRDDDAIAPSGQLDQLLELAGETGMPVHLAVIPHGATQELAERLADTPLAVPVIHGFLHQNHAPDGEKKCEFGADRVQRAVRDDISNGAAKMQKLFGPNIAPMFVPPWNRFAPIHLPILAGAGFQAISTFTPRQRPEACAGLAQINTHIDPIDWHGTRSAHSADLLIAQTVELLHNRRNGSQDNNEPLGFLTHHLVHDSAIWDFSVGFLETMLVGPVSLWNAHTLKGSKT